VGPRGDIVDRNGYVMVGDQVQQEIVLSRASATEHPDVIVLASARTDRFEAWDWNPWEEPLFASCRSAGFERVALRRFGPDYWLWVMAVPGSAAAGKAGALPSSTASPTPSTPSRPASASPRPPSRGGHACRDGTVAILTRRRGPARRW